MTSLNNCHGHIINDGSILYEEYLEDGVIFVVIQKYEKSYVKENFGDSSHFCLEAIIYNGNKHTYSNGVISLTNNDRQEFEPFPKLREIKTKDGFRVFEHAYFHHEVDNKKCRRVIWLIEVPKEDLKKFI